MAIGILNLVRSLRRLEIVDYFLGDDRLASSVVAHTNFESQRLLTLLCIYNGEVLCHLLTRAWRDLGRGDALKSHAHVLLDGNLESNL